MPRLYQGPHGPSPEQDGEGDYVPGYQGTRVLGAVRSTCRSAGVRRRQAVATQLLILPLTTLAPIPTISVPSQHFLPHPTALVEPPGLDLRPAVSDVTLPNAGRKWNRQRILWNCTKSHVSSATWVPPTPHSQPAPAVNSGSATGGQGLSTLTRSTYYTQTHWTLTLSGLIVSRARGPSPSSG